MPACCYVCLCCRGGASQQLSLSALLPQPGMSPPLDDWGAEGESPLSGAGFWRCILACHSKVGQQIARKRVSTAHWLAITLHTHRPTQANIGRGKYRILWLRHLLRHNPIIGSSSRHRPPCSWQSRGAAV